MGHAFASSDGYRSQTIAAFDGASPDGLVAVLTEHYMPIAKPACLDLCIADRPEASRRFALDRAIVCSPIDPSAAAPSARITMTATALESMLAAPTRFDARSPEIAALGGVRVEGAERLAAYWLQLLKRPTAQGAAALERAQSRTLPPLVEVTSIDAREADSWPQRIVTSIRVGLPLRVRGALNWPEVDWTLTQWREHEGSVVLRDDPRTGRSETLGDFLPIRDEASASPLVEKDYTGGSPMPPAWEQRFCLPQLPRSLFGPAQLWFGKRSQDTLVTHLHCDLANSFLAQVHGHKRVRLYAPRESSNVYALDAFNTYRPCRVDASAPDVSRFPRFADARFVEVTIGPGDLLVIPTGWFHCVWVTGATLSISRFADDAAIDSYAQTKGASCTRAVPNSI